MKVSDERLDEILDQLQRGQDMSKATPAEWLSLAAELRQLRLRISSQSRSTPSSKPAPSSH